MKKTDLIRSQVSNEHDPFNHINKEQPSETDQKQEDENNSKEYKEQQKKVFDKLLEEGNDVVRLSGYGEAMLRKDLHLQDKKIIFDEDELDTKKQVITNKAAVLTEKHDNGVDISNAEEEVIESGYNQEEFEEEK